ncbi:hypothetical protein HanXRQr2_Chr16g0739341 [Helianthus annuus]|uniref:Uncharacterized protein n=1 Tax=Helianthus annuus TaxID=4232 RepID=A0A9K3DS08_HELAN|nr:hypothetical protein HanXRQr2_Chr16g0739341 [Helianthus annuus]KAJ0820517.1 hypothetical protein HanPSC8_Chr16g0708941 [Helianthus annuus]
MQEVKSFTSSSQVFLWPGDGGTHTCPFSKELSIARKRVFDISVRARWFLACQLIVVGDSDPDNSTTCGIGGLKAVPEMAA